MKFKHTFPACSGDYFGYVSPTYLMREIDEGVAKSNYEDGVGFAHLFPTIGVTWMMGQCVLEYLAPVSTADEVEIEASGHEQHGPAVVRRCTMYYQGKEAMRFTAKLLPVYYHARKAAPPQVLEPFWKTPAIPTGELVPFVSVPQNMEQVEEYVVRYRDCDTNKHLTAFRYLDLILEAVGYWEGEMHLVRRLQIDYRRESVVGETLSICHAERDGVHYVSGVKSDGTVSFNASVLFDENITPPAKAYNV